MPTERSTGAVQNPPRKGMQEYFDKFCSTVTLRTTTLTVDGMNRTTATSTATSTIQADLQWPSKRDIEKLNIGNIKQGDGLLFVKYDASIDLDNDLVYYEVSHNSEYWRLIEQVEGEELGDGVIYKAFTVKRNAQV